MVLHVQDIADGSTGLTVRIFSGRLAASLVAVGFLGAITRTVATVLAGGRRFRRSNSRIVLRHVVLLDVSVPVSFSFNRHTVAQKGAALAAHVPNSIARPAPASRERTAGDR